MLDHSLIDLLPEDMEVAGDRLHQGALQRSRRYLIIDLLPLSNGRCMEVDILEAIDFYQHKATALYPGGDGEKLAAQKYCN
ncbi:hypothetical protein [Pandoraea sp.]|uniref:hypothetical protein n=1 Tax=Pandoraea sp. TaxID=1883445 RepID=UPI0025E3E8C4|nr:hypothetical protein [Pandoraea sp.]